VATNLSTANGLGMIMRDFGSGRGKLLRIEIAPDHHAQLYRIEDLFGYGKRLLLYWTESAGNDENAQRVRDLVE